MVSASLPISLQIYFDISSMMNLREILLQNPKRTNKALSRLNLFFWLTNNAPFIL